MLEEVKCVHFQSKVPQPITETTTATVTTTEEWTTTSLLSTTDGPTTTEPPSTTTQLPTTTEEPSTTVTTTTQAPTTTTEEPTTTTQGLYNETADYYIPDLREYGVDVGAQPVRTTIGPHGFGWAIKLDTDLEGNTTSCLAFSNFSKGEDTACWLDPFKCKRGISLSIWVRIRFRRDDNIPRYILSTGGYEEGSKGISLHYRGIYLCSVVSSGPELWSLVVPGLLPNNTWCQVGIRWHRRTGLEMYTDGRRIASVKYPVIVTGVSRPSHQNAELTIGCRRAEEGDYLNFAYGEFDEFVAWMWSLEDSQLDYFMGQYACDPETHLLKCESDANTVLKMLENVEFENVKNVEESLHHLKELAIAKKEAEHTEPVAEADVDESYDENSDQVQGDGQESKNRKDLINMIEILQTVMKKTADVPYNLSLEELKKLLGVLDIGSSILTEDYEKGWSDLHKTKPMSVVLIQQLEKWQLRKLSHTRFEGTALKTTYTSDNIVSQKMKTTVMDMKDEHDAYIFLPDEIPMEETLPKWVNLQDTVAVPADVVGERPFGTVANLQIAIYDTLDRILVLHNFLTGVDDTLVFLDSRVVSVDCIPIYSSEALTRKPLLLSLEHRRKVASSGRKLLASKFMIQNGEIKRRYCVRWDDSLLVKGSSFLGGWNTDGCSVYNTSAGSTVCQCDVLGIFAVLAHLRKPIELPPEAEWVRVLKWVGYVFSSVYLLVYILVICIKGVLHEQFHVIRLNLAIAALGGLVTFSLTDYLRHDEEACRVVSVFIHLFYTGVAMWLVVESFALFSIIVNGSIRKRGKCYCIFGWSIPLGIIICGFIFFKDYGYDHRCLVGPTKMMRWYLVAPIILSTGVALVIIIITCVHLRTPAIKKASVAEELSWASRTHLAVVTLFAVTWIFGMLAFVDLGTGDNPAWNGSFQVLNSWLGIYIVVLKGLGSRHFRKACCEKPFIISKSNQIHIDPFDMHDEAMLENARKIYAA